MDGIDWIRLLYSYPAKFGTELVDAFADLEKLVPYIDMPLQHISSPILKSMRRGVSRERTERLLDNLRSRLPEVAIRTGFIVGYPGESEAQFQELYDFVAEQRFDNVGVFTFSAQPETPAADLDDDVPAAVKEERREALMLLQQQIHLEKNEAVVGREFDVLLEGTHPETELLWIGRTPFQAPEVDGQVLVSDAGDAKFGDIVRMEIVEAAGYDLVAEIVG